MEDVDIRPIDGDIFLENYIPDGEWDITETNCTRNEAVYPCCPNDVSPFASRPKGNL